MFGTISPLSVGMQVHNVCQVCLHFLAHASVGSSVAHLADFDFHGTCADGKRKSYLAV
jgi:hypothetical protein